MMLGFHSLTLRTRCGLCHLSKRVWTVSHSMKIDLDMLTGMGRIYTPCLLIQKVLGQDTAL
jgi:hypothetical protein